MTKHNSAERKAIIVGVRLAGMKFTKIGEIFNIPVSTAKSIYEHYHIHKTVESLPRSGRPAILSTRDKRAIKRTAVASRCAPLAAITASSPAPISKSTVRRALHQMGFFNRVAQKKPYLCPKHMADRLHFARRYRYWSKEDWAKIIWTDEASFEVGFNTRQVTVWRRSYEKYNFDCLAPTFKSGRTSVMVWGAITSTTKSELVFLPVGERTALDFVHNVYDGALGDY